MISKAEVSTKKYGVFDAVWIAAVNIMVRRSRQSGVARATCPD